MKIRQVWANKIDLCVKYDVVLSMPAMTTEEHSFCCQTSAVHDINPHKNMFRLDSVSIFDT